MLTLEYYQPGSKAPSETYQKPTWALIVKLQKELKASGRYKKGTFKIRGHQKQSPRKKTLYEKLYNQ